MSDSHAKIARDAKKLGERLIALHRQGQTVEATAADDEFIRTCNEQWYRDTYGELWWLAFYFAGCVI